MESPLCTVTLELDLDTETISGSIARRGRATRPFYGWLELAAALQALRASEVRAKDQTPPSDAGTTAG
jgi:hypothetical protein